MWTQYLDFLCVTDRNILHYYYDKQSLNVTVGDGGCVCGKHPTHTASHMNIEMDVKQS